MKQQHKCLLKQVEVTIYLCSNAYIHICLNKVQHSYFNLYFN